MDYRSLGRCGLKVSTISLGTEYLLNQPSDVAFAVVREAVSRGVNYFDLFWAQPEFRSKMGGAFAGLRNLVMLAAHLGATVTDGQGDRTRDPKLALQYFEDFLERYRTDYVDILYLHNIDERGDYEKAFAPGGLRDLALELKAQGKCRAIGFSGHTVETARMAAESGDVDVIMFPVNMTGHGAPGRRAFFERCAELGVGLVAMKPYAGGKLLQHESKLKLEMWHTGNGEMEVERHETVTPAQCLAYVLAQPGISTIVPGCKDVVELREALAYYEATTEQRDFSAVLKDFDSYKGGECVYCNHCLPCPAGIDIGETNRLLDLAKGNPTDELRAAYAKLTPASECTECGSCLERCPFGVDAPLRIGAAAYVYEGKQ